MHLWVNLSHWNAFDIAAGAFAYLDEYMENRGFYFISEEQMGGMLVYSNGSEKEYILFSTNKYYSKWEWQ